MKIFLHTAAALFCAAWTLALASCADSPKPMKMNSPRNIRGVVSYRRSFNDLNETHLAAARAIGVQPVADRDEAEHLTGNLDLVATCENYVLDSLTHSIPFLVPRAHDVLNGLGRSFRDSLASKGLNPYQIIVTSVLRTQHDVKRLSRRNVNATANSAHCYGTTFDVSYKRFASLPDPDGHPLQPVREDTLKMVLAEVLRDFKAQGDCYVKYELKQGCFHITAR